MVFFLVLISKIGLLQSSENFDFVRPSWVTLAEIKLFLVEDHSVAQIITSPNLLVMSYVSKHSNQDHKLKC